MGVMVGFLIQDGDHSAVDRGEHRRPKPTKPVGGSGRSKARQPSGALRPAASTPTKSMACADANSVVPWLGTRSAGLFCVSHAPVNGQRRSRIMTPTLAATAAGSPPRNRMIG